MPLALAAVGHRPITTREPNCHKAVAESPSKQRFTKTVSQSRRFRTPSYLHFSALRSRSSLIAAAAAAPPWPVDPADTGDAAPVSQQTQTAVVTSSVKVPVPAATSSKPQQLGGTTAAPAADDAAAVAAHAAVVQRLSGCPECSGSGRISCKECEGQGFLKRGGYNKKNPLNMSRITGSKWTAMHETLGWRHFRVIQQRKLDKHTVYLLLQASCDCTAQLWVNAQNLRNRAAWAAGWLQMSEIQGLGAEVQGTGHKCQSCAGLGYKPCVTCDGTGRPSLIVL